MIELIANNLVRRIGRTLLTALGVGLGVATIVALLSVSDGLTQTAAGFVHLGGSDLGVFQAGRVRPDRVGAPGLAVARLERNPDVARATPLLLIVGKVRGDASAFVFGADPQGFFARRLVFASAAAPPARGAIAVGDGLAARRSTSGPGSRARGRRPPPPVSGVYHSGIPHEDQGAVLPLAAAQALTGQPARRRRSRSSWRRARASPPRPARSRASSPTRP